VDKKAKNILLGTIEKSQPDDYPSTLEKRLSECIPSTKNERRILMEIMACTEILKPGSYNRPSRRKHDWKYIEHWRGEDKYNKEMAEKYFGGYIK
jgi:hypothetical protein